MLLSLLPFLIYKALKPPESMKVTDICLLPFLIYKALKPQIYVLTKLCDLDYYNIFPSLKLYFTSQSGICHYQ